MNESIQLKTETERLLFDELSRLQREVILLNEENDYIRRTMKRELLTWIPVVISHLYKQDNKFDSTVYNQALDDSKKEIDRWLK